MKILPILFSTEMVRAILDGKKTQTRRTMGLEKFNLNPEWFRYDGICSEKNQIHYLEILNIHGEPTEKYTSFSAKLKPGDIFWVRETFYKTSAPELNGAYYYKASIEEGWDFKWKPSIFMPKDACRIFLEVTDVRVERLQDISEEDAIAEGVSDAQFLEDIGYKCYVDPALFYRKTNKDAAKMSFFSLWMKINGAASLDNNPWVWVYEFKQVEKPKNFT